MNYSQITFQDRQNIYKVTDSYTLTGGMPTPSYIGITVNVALTKYDLDNLKELTVLDLDKYLYISSRTVVGMNRNPVIPISVDNALVVASHFPDILLPEIINYCLDMDGAHFLELTFSETINVSSVIPSSITI